jgi:hypothetical protein
MTFIFALLGKAWPAIIGVVIGLGSWAAIFINKKNSETKLAQAGQQTEAAKADAARSEAIASATNEVNAKADQAAAEQALNSAKESQNVQKEWQGLPPGEAVHRLYSDGWVRNDDGTVASAPDAVPAAPATGSSGENKSH